MQYDMRPDRLGWTLFDVTTGRPVVWDDVPLTGVDLDAAHELLVLLNRRLFQGTQLSARRFVGGLAPDLQGRLTTEPPSGARPTVMLPGIA
jgi:hypothetical protein